MTWKRDWRLRAGLLLSLSLPMLRGQEAIAIENVTLIDGTGRSAKPNACVVVTGSHIATTGTCPVALPANARHISGKGKYLIPGLMDVHVHLRGGGGFDSSGPNEQTGIRHLHSYIYAGVTTILDVGNNPDFIFKLRDMERSGKIVSPRLLAAGGIVTYPGSHGSGRYATLVDSWPGSMATVDEAIARKPDMMKLTYDEHGWGTRPMITLLPVDLMTKVIRYYNDHGIRTTAHTSSETRALEAIFAGIDTLAHPIIQGPVSDNYVRLMRAKLIPEASTLTIGENYSRLAEHPEYLDQPLYRDTMEPDEIKRLKTVESGKQKENRWAAWMKVMTPVAQDNLKKITAGGGIIALGTDQSLGAAVHRELELMVGGGIPPLEAIRIGTLNSAIFLGRERDMGSVEEGKLADLVLLDADPLDDINNAKKISMVIKDGKIVDRGKLDLPVNRAAGGAH